MDGCGDRNGVEGIFVWMRRERVVGRERVLVARDDPMFGYGGISTYLSPIAPLEPTCIT